MFLCRGMEEPMKKNITKKAAVFLLSTIVAAQSGLSVQAAALTEGSWEQTRLDPHSVRLVLSEYGRRKSGNRLEEYQWSGLLFYSGK